MKGREVIFLGVSKHSGDELTDSWDDYWTEHMMSWKTSRGCEGQRDPWKPANQGPNAGRNRYSIREQSQQLLFWNSFFFSCVCLFGVFFLPFTVVIYHHLGPHHLGYIFGSFFFSTEQANFRSFGKQIEGFLRQISNIQRHPPITNFAEFCRDGIFSPWNDNSIFAAFQKTGPFLHLRGKDRWWPSNDFIFFGATFANFGMVFSAEIFSFTQGIGCER